MQKLINGALKKHVEASAPVLSMVNRSMLFEGDSMGVIYPDGRHEAGKLTSTESAFSVTSEELPSLKTEDFMGRVAGAGKDMGEQIERGLLETMAAAADESGNTFKSDTGLTPSTLLDALEKLYVDFEDDDRNKPVMPSLVSHPDSVDGLMKADQALTPEERSALDERHKRILDAKYEEHMKDVESRKIID